MNSLDKIGGIPLIMKKLEDSNLIHGKCINCYRKNNCGNLDNLSEKDLRIKFQDQHQIKKL